MKKYDFKKIEKKWQAAWEKQGIYRARDFDKKPKYYCLVEFPYPSGDGLHVGHIRSYTALDIVARKRRMEGFNVLYPIGWDAFGLPTENYAVKTGIQPAVVTKRNADTFRRQLKAAGFSFDWNREINTTDPEYFKWTQWMFLQFLKHGLAYKAKTTINWCPKDKIGLANEEAVGGKCERCGTPVLKREKEQWMIKITAYAEKLLEGLNHVDFLPEIKLQQINWIGKSEGALLTFPLKAAAGDVKEIEVFTTRPDTLFGATYMVVAPEHPLVSAIVSGEVPTAKNKAAVAAYAKKAMHTPEVERTAEQKEKTGVQLEGVFAVNPATGGKIPIFVSDYVLGSYGTSAVMAVPAHDTRDFAFAKKFKLPVVMVICPNYPQKICPVLNDAYEDPGYLIESGKFSGMESEKAKKEIVKFAGGKWTVKYKLRDWVFSRQRYWGEPIPVIRCENDGYVPVPEKDLPVTLPKVKNYKPRDDGESPLASVTAWVNVKCPVCKGPAKRETDTMPNWAGSSWYFLRYLDPNNKKTFADKKKQKYFMPVDWYNGGMEHVTLHLLYSRFWNRFLYDIGEVLYPEPYQKRTAHGLILGEGGVKMSKSKGNVVNPDKVIAAYGADTLRVYEMFIGPFDQAIAWDSRGIEGAARFLGKVWTIGTTKEIDEHVRDRELARLLHKTIKKVGEDIEKMSFNTAVSALMVFANECLRSPAVPAELWEMFLRIVAPFAPHLAEELWQMRKKKTAGGSIHTERWPAYEEKLTIEEMIQLVIQVNGKVRDTVSVPRDIDEADATSRALASERVKVFLDGKKPKRIIYVPGRLVNIVM